MPGTWSHAGPIPVFVFYTNDAHIAWYSMKQNEVESSTFESELAVAQIATDMLAGALHYMLLMFGILWRVLLTSFVITAVLF